MYVIVGANGFLGSYLIRTILEQTQDSILAADLKMGVKDPSGRVAWVSCDVTRKEDVKRLADRMLAESSPCKVFYLAAYHHPDLVQKNPKIAWNVNITALSEFLNMVENVGCLYYPSTDTVYGEGDLSRHFSEDAYLNPVNLYGRHKAAAECLVNTYGYNVVRFPFLAGPSLLLDKKHFYDEIVETLSQGKPMQMFADSYRSSLDFGTVASFVVRLAENHTEDMPKIINVSVDQAEGVFVAARAKATLLDNTRLKRTLGLHEVKIKL